MIDISDGLASELLHLAKGSKVGLQIFDEKLPIDPLTQTTALEFNLDPSTCACNGGEDYELIFTFNQKDLEKIEKIPGISMIGYVTEEEKGCLLVTKAGKHIPLTAQGWKSF